MSVIDVSLGISTRTNLLSLQETSSLIARTQNRLSTQKKVNSALDNAQAYFQASNLTNRAGDFAKLKDGIDQAVSIVKSSMQGVSGITDLIQQMQGLTSSAKNTNDTSERSKLASQFDMLRLHITNLAGDASYNGTNLIKSNADNLTVTFNETGTSKMTVTGTAMDTVGLTLTCSANDWGSDANIDTSTNILDNALSTLRATASRMGTNSSLLGIRLDFTKTLVTTLQEGAGKLVNADMNEESANLLALQTRQQLGTISLSLAQKSESSVLSLF
ncbi:MAG: flagellin [Alphaproteobacteria bacterium]